MTEEIRKKREDLRKEGWVTFNSTSEAFRLCGLSKKRKKSDVVSSSVSEPKVKKSKSSSS